MQGCCFLPFLLYEYHSIRMHPPAGLKPFVTRRTNMCHAADPSAYWVCPECLRIALAGVLLRQDWTGNWNRGPLRGCPIARYDHDSVEALSINTLWALVGTQPFGPEAVNGVHFLTLVPPCF